MLCWQALTCLSGQGCGFGFTTGGTSRWRGGLADACVNVRERVFGFCNWNCEGSCSKAGRAVVLTIAAVKAAPQCCYLVQVSQPARVPCRATNASVYLPLRSRWELSLLLVRGRRCWPAGRLPGVRSQGRGDAAAMAGSIEAAKSCPKLYRRLSKLYSKGGHLESLRAAGLELRARHTAQQMEPGSRQYEAEGV